MSIRFVNSLDEVPKAPNFVDVGVQVFFATVSGMVKPYRVVEADGTTIDIGVPMVV